MRRLLAVLVAASVLPVSSLKSRSAPARWKSRRWLMRKHRHVPLQTAWSNDAKAPQSKQPWAEHPRPDLVRPTWQSLNGLWHYKVTQPPVLPEYGAGLYVQTLESVSEPVISEGQILVPFALESNLSGVVSKGLKGDQVLWYERVVDYALPASGNKESRQLLHFEAVDYECAVAVNGKHVGHHRGGSTPFSFDVTGYMKSGLNSIVVRVLDATDNYQLVGKQSFSVRGIYYSLSSGIRQSVWLETVPETYVKALRIRTTADPPSVSLRASVAGSSARGVSFDVTVLDQGRKVASETCSSVDSDCVVSVPDAKLWSPEAPNLYDLQLNLRDANGNVVDTVSSYTGIRTVGKQRDADGHLRFTLNGKFVFHWGTLDQGWWPDGGLTPPSEKAMQFDVDFLKAAGFNTIRKHMKVEPRRFYEYCDRVGMLVWQDQVAAPGCEAGHTPCNNVTKTVSGGWKKQMWSPRNFTAQHEAAWPDDAHTQFMAELQEMVDALQNYPSIVTWTPFNEGWGQHRTMEVGEWLKSYDKSRLINIASGGNFWPIGDIADAHSYPDPAFPAYDRRFQDYVQVAGEFGGHGFAVEGHVWDAQREFSYTKSADTAVLKQKYEKSLKELHAVVKKGAAGAIYTQTTDVETELNGLLTYDRAVTKLSAAYLRQALGASGVLEAAAAAVVGL